MAWTALERARLMKIAPRHSCSGWKRVAIELGTGRTGASVRAEHDRIATSDFERFTGSGKAFKKICKKCGLMKRGHICPVELAQQTKAEAAPGAEAEAAAAAAAGAATWESEGLDAWMRTDYQAQLQDRAEQEDFFEFARALGYDGPA